MLRQIKARSLGRLELLAWLNQTLETDYARVEDLGDGVAYCQLFDCCLGSSVRLHAPLSCAHLTASMPHLVPVA